MGVNAGDELPETEAGGHGFGQIDPHPHTKVLIALFGEPVLLKEDVCRRRRIHVGETKAPVRPLLCPQKGG